MSPIGIRLVQTHLAAADLAPSVLSLTTSESVAHESHEELRVAEYTDTRHSEITVHKRWPTVT